MGLRNLGLSYTSVGVSEIDSQAILGSAAIHTCFLDIRESHLYPSDELMWQYLENINAPLHSKTFEFIGRKLKGDKLKDMYLANMLIQNRGDISKINTDLLPEIDLFTYSFPCQDISVAGERKGFDEGTGTKSSLLFECKKIIDSKRPKVLLLENVKNLVGNKFKDGFDEWVEYLDTLGYKTFWKVIDSKYHGVAQTRPRVFAVSILDGGEFEFPKDSEDMVMTRSIIESDVPESFYTHKEYICVDKGKVVAEFIKGSFEQGKRIHGLDRVFQCLGALERGTNNILLDTYRVRKLTSKECWRLMGFSDEDHDKASEVCSNNQLVRLAGNSIVVNVLEGIFRSLYIKEMV